MSSNNAKDLCDSLINVHYARNMMTGSYSNNIYLYNCETLAEINLHADKGAFKAKRLGSAKNKMAMGGNRNGVKGRREDVDAVDFNKKILHASWHPRENSIAVAATNNLFIFT